MYQEKENLADRYYTLCILKNDCLVESTLLSANLGG